MKLFPKIKICSVGVKYSDPDTFSAGGFTPIDSTITIDIPCIKENYENWRRQIIVVLSHEFSHFLYNLFHPYPCHWDNIDFVELFKDELRAYKIQLFLESLLFLDHDWDSPEEGAVSSVSSMVYQFKKYYNES
jgi:hypothetical protein